MLNTQGYLRKCVSPITSFIPQPVKQPFVDFYDGQRRKRLEALIEQRKRSPLYQRRKILRRELCTLRKRTEDTTAELAQRDAQITSLEGSVQELGEQRTKVVQALSDLSQSYRRDIAHLLIGGLTDEAERNFEVLGLYEKLPDDMMEAAHDMRRQLDGVSAERDVLLARDDAYWEVFGKVVENIPQPVAYFRRVAHLHEGLEPTGERSADTGFHFEYFGGSEKWEDHNLTPFVERLLRDENYKDLKTAYKLLKKRDVEFTVDGRRVKLSPVFHNKHLIAVEAEVIKDNREKMGVMDWVKSALHFPGTQTNPS